MGHYYTKIEYESEGPYASTEKHTLYCHHNVSADCVTVYEEDGTVLIAYGEWSDKHMGNQLPKLLFTNLPLKPGEDSEVQYMSPEEIKKIIHHGK
jgi:hypothetical protein